jgi:hypothetical protein
VGSQCAGMTRTWSPTLTGSSGAKVTCSSEQNHTWAPSMVGFPWSIPSDFRPTLATAYGGMAGVPGHTEMTCPSTNSACPNGSPRVLYWVSISA